MRKNIVIKYSHLKDRLKRKENGKIEDRSVITLATVAI